MQTARAPLWDPAQPEIMEMPDRLDSGTVLDMEQGMQYCIQNGIRNLVLDCGSLNYLTSAGLRAILTVAKDVQMMHGKLAVCNLQGQPQEMFTVCGFDRIVPVYDHRDEAMENLAA